MTRELVRSRKKQKASSAIMPRPGSAEEIRLFRNLQKNFARQYALYFPDSLASKTVIVLPSLTLDQEVLSKVKGALHYEERLLCLLMLLRMPRTQVIYLSSMPIDPAIIDYYLHFTSGITSMHANRRLTMISCYDASPVSLTEKILQRPRLLDRIKKSIEPGNVAHIAGFNVTPFERTLAVRLDVPIFGCDPDLNYWGSKSGCRRLFASAGVNMAPGMEDLKSFEEIVNALTSLKEKYPAIKKAMIKLNEGFSGDGNAVFKYPRQNKDLRSWIRDNLRNEMIPVASDLSRDDFLEKFSLMGGIVEAFIEGDFKASPSVQFRIDPLGEVELISTHDQVLGGESNQIFLGAHFPCDEIYRNQISVLGKKVATEMKKKGVLGRFSIDFISVKEKNGWNHFAVEVNLRKGGTSHPHLMLQFLTNGRNTEDGLFITPTGQYRYYFSSDNLQQERYKGLVPQDLIDIAMIHGLLFDSSTQKGVMFHMIGALSQYGKIGVLCVGSSREEAYAFYEKAVQVLDREAESG
jgi:hypothetical protein